jgi:hypothetical protein
MLSEADLERMWRDPQVLAAEQRFVQARRKVGNQLKNKFSFRNLVRFIANDYTFAEAGEKMGVPREVVEANYSMYCVDLPYFKYELACERSHRIRAQRLAKRTEELFEELQAENPVLRSVVVLARAMGCVVTPLRQDMTKSLRLRPYALNIDGKTCSLHIITSRFKPETEEDPSPLARVRFWQSSLFKYDVRVICQRVPDFSVKDFVVPSLHIHEKLFSSPDAPPFRSVAIPLDRRNRRGLELIQLESYRNRYDRIKYL